MSPSLPLSCKAGALKFLRPALKNQEMSHKNSSSCFPLKIWQLFQHCTHIPSQPQLVVTVISVSTVPTVPRSAPTSLHYLPAPPLPPGVLSDPSSPCSPVPRSVTALVTASCPSRFLPDLLRPQHGYVSRQSPCPGVTQPQAPQPSPSSSDLVPRSPISFFTPW